MYSSALDCTIITPFADLILGQIKVGETQVLVYALATLDRWMRRGE